MILKISATDIKSITFAFISDDQILEEKEIKTEPDGYLKALNSFVKNRLDEVEAIDVVRGPGSFTASRISVTIANTISFAKNIPILKIKEKNTFALPVYNRPPHITLSKQAL